MAVILADTDVLIDYLAGVSPVTEQMKSYLGEERVTTTVINCFELLSGTREDSRGDRIRQFVDLLPVLSLDPIAAYRAARVRRKLEGAGRGIGMGDSLIAGIALTHGIPLWTRNQRHFERVEELQLVR